jgi:hypothetical protein
MECSQSGAIRDEELVAFIEGESVRPAVVEHLAHCQKCSSQVALYRQLEQGLTSKLYRWDCPASQTLGEYQLGLLNREQAAAIQAHLRACVLCSSELVTLIDFLDADADPMLVERVANVPGRVPEAISSGFFLPPMSRLADNIKQGVGRVREEALSGIQSVVALLLPPQPGISVQRGSSAQADSARVWPRNYQAESVTISLNLEPDPRQRDALQLIGLVMRQGAEVDALDGLQTRLLEGDTVVQTQCVDDLGNLVFSALKPATYTLELLFPERTIIVEQIPVIALRD